MLGLCPRSCVFSNRHIHFQEVVFPHLFLWYAGSQGEKGLGRIFSSLCRLHSLLSSVSYVTFVSSLTPRSGGSGSISPSDEHPVSHVDGGL